VKNINTKAATAFLKKAFSKEMTTRLQIKDIKKNAD